MIQPTVSPAHESFPVIHRLRIDGIGLGREPYDLEFKFTRISGSSGDDGGEYALTVSVEGARVSRLLDKFWIPVDSHGLPVSFTLKEDQTTKIMTFRIEWKDSTISVIDLSTSPKNLMEAP